ncbi:EamA family transporter [Marinobacterium sp. YM272]|uniref:EamA family transporter n=1 Tax=Marinobacterium sp. YM272 TaxID=3421654 RepID=UPI003D7F4DE2
MIQTIVYPLVAAVLFAIAIHIQRQATRSLDDRTGTVVSVLSIALLFWSISGWRFDLSYWFSDATPYFLVAGIFFPALAQRLQIVSTKHIGPALTGALGSFLPLFAAIPAVWFLGEHLTLQQYFGISVLIGALFVAAIVRGVSWHNAGFYLLFLPLAATLSRSIGFPIAKAGYNQLPEPLFGTLAMSTASAVTILVMRIISGSPGKVLALSKGHAFFALNGILIGLGFMLVQFSLSAGAVTITASIVSSVPIWTLLCGALVFKSESLTWKHGVIGVGVFIGAVMIVTGGTSS